MNDRVDESPKDLSEAERQRLGARWEAAEILGWGGLAPDPPSESSPGFDRLPEGWTDVTDIVLDALAQVRAKEKLMENPPD